MNRTLFRAAVLVGLGFAMVRPPAAEGEAMLQYFNTDWNEIAMKMPELAEAGYDSLWLPPPTKGSGGLSVGYDLWDRFDLGSKDQRGSVRTRYGTEADLLRMVEVAHRFGIRVYFDNVMNHNAFDVPGYNASTPIDIYPGLVPEDFHLRLTQEGFYRKWDNISNWNDSWQVQHRNFSDLIDLAQEPGPTNQNFGLTEGSTFPKIKFLRQPNNPEYYCYDANNNYVGFGPNNGLTVQYLHDHADYYSEYVQDFLNRSARWLLDRTKADGLRLDAVKHVPYDFFGASFGADKDSSDYGYLGQAQRQFNITRGFSDTNHRDTVFDTEKPRDDAMMFGEHLGEPPPYGDYFNAGMRLVNNPLQSAMNGILGNPSSGLQGLDQPGSYGFSDSLGVMYAQSHDNDYASRRELQFALYLTRAGLGSVYTDGNHQSQTLSQSGGAFPRHANTNFLGQFNDPLLPNLLYIHNQFARGTQFGRWSDGDLVAYERIDKRENPTMSDGDGVVALVLVNDNYANGIGINNNFGGNRGNLRTAFPPGAYLWQYASGPLPSGDSMTGFYSTVGDGGSGLGYLDPSIIVPKGGYYVFSWRNPEQSDLWSQGGGKPLVILQGGQPVGTLTYLRKDGPDGDPNFNPYNVAGAVPGSYSYPYSIPRVTNGADLTFLARADGSAENILMELDGGVDINSQIPLGPTTGEKRDNPPALRTDVFLGYEQPMFVEREYPEKFAAKNSANDTLGSTGADTYDTTTSPPTDVSSSLNGNAAFDSQGGTVASFVFHDPGAQVEGPVSGTINGLPSTQFRDNGGSLDFWAKTNSVGFGFRTFLYYTTDGSNPEGAGGEGIGTTQTLEMMYSHNSSDGNNWWRATLSPKPGSSIKYKISIYKSSTGTAQSPVPVTSVFPGNAAAVAQKKKMLTTFKIPHFNATTALVYPHNDYGVTQTGLTEGFHVLRARSFLKRDSSGVGNGLRSSIYNTFVQPFYYDAQSPQGEIKFPAENDTIGGSRYGVVVRTDASVTEVWYHIDDGDSSNNDVNTHTQGGNGVGFEPFTDSNGNGTWDAGEAFQDLNGDGVWNNNIAGTWVKATEVTANPAVTSIYPREWRFDYANIPANGSAMIKVRLRELSSAGYKDFGQSDSLGHYTTLVRNVITAGPSTRMFVAFPSNDGDLVDSNYIMKVWFSKSLADGTTMQSLINRFLIKLASSESGSSANGVAQSRTGYSIHYDVTNDYHELAFQLPNLYNDNPDFLHTIDVTYTNPGSPTLEAFRLVKARAVPVIRDVIVTPPEVDSDGKPYVITLPDVAAPTAAQRAVPVQVETDLNASNVAVSFGYGSGSVTLNPSTSGTPNPSTSGSSKFWSFTWNGAAEGNYQLVSTVTAPSGTATATRNAQVVFRQIVAADPNKHDVDDDGLGLYGPTSAPIETTAIPLPTTNSETWTNDQVHIWAISGKTDPLDPDTDGDDLSDGLELGWGNAVDDTNVNTDTNGDGVPNFQSDLDPPIYNTTDNGSPPAGQDYSFFDPWPYNLNNSRTDLIAGTVTDPNKQDTDGDAILDGLEDYTSLVTSGGGTTTYKTIHNGRVDIGVPDGNGVLHAIAHPPTIYNTSTVDAQKVLAHAPNAVWLETDPNNNDTDGDGVTDGNEDSNQNGIVDLAIIDRNQIDGQGNYVVIATLDDFKKSVTVTGSIAGSQSTTLKYSDFCSTFIEPTNGLTYTSTGLDKTKLNAVFRPGGNIRADKLDVIWLETDPRRKSTSGDGLPDGWKLQYGLDPWDDGAIGDYNLHTGKVITNNNNGPSGSLSGDGITNQQHFINGTDPRVPVNAPPPPAGSITIGNGSTTTVGAVTNKHEFTDWTADDLIALDPYDGDGSNNSQADIYHAYDGFDTSRDLVAFYARDGGAVAQGGDGNFYFRVDMQDLKAYAEQGNLDIYVVINFGHSGVGEYNLPDDVDTGTALKWQAVVACYQSDNGRIYLWNQNSATHSTAIGQNLTQFGVTVRDQNTANGFKKAYYNSDLDAVEFSISRQALLDAGWDGDATKLLYQVFTTKDGTSDNPVGAGDIGGRSDIRDSIRNDSIASDYWQDQPNIAGANSVLRQWIGITADNDRGKRVKIMSVVHGNQAIQPGSVTQNLINNGAGAGYYRPLDAHEAYGVPFALHVTPTLASAIQWAKVASGSPNTFHDGPAFNARIGNLIGAGTVDLLGSTFSDHILDYFNSPYNIDNVGLANSFLTNIYGHAPSTAVFWTPERVSDSGVLQKANDAGFGYTFVDQMRHIFKWFGRNSALGSDGYRINQINNTNTFVINDGVSNQLFVNDDNGLPVLLRQLLSRKARDGQQDQVVTFVNQWEDFGTKTNADAYDKNIRWLASHPWVQIVTPDQIAANQVAYNSNGGTSTQWGTVARGTSLLLPNVSKDFIDHADEENYDNWYNGSGLEESLKNKVFSIRTGVALPTAYGLLGTSGIVNTTWNSVSGIVPTAATTGLFALARATLHASEFETAFHEQANNDLSKFSTGAYINPDTAIQTLAGFSKIAQAQTRNAAIYARVNIWSQAAAAGNYTGSAVAEQTDVDLDGENEYLIYNDRIFALFERIGGRMTHAWLRDYDTGYVSQVIGNPVSYAGLETEEEGAGNFASGAVIAYRTSGFKDWFAKTDNTGAGTFGYVNDLYNVVAAPSGIGWKFTSSDGKISKTITLGAGKNSLQANYTTTGFVQLYVRFGLSPDLLDLLMNGQTHLGNLLTSAPEVDLFNNNNGRSVRGYLRFGGTGFSGATFNATANDSDALLLDTVAMRNQAQTQQVELQGNGSMNFAVGFETGAALTYDTDADGIPDWWTQQYFGHVGGQTGDLSRPGDDPDGDGRTNLQEYVLGTNPKVADGTSNQLTIVRPSPTTVTLSFPTIHNRLYQVYYATSPTGTWLTAGSAVFGTGSTMNYTDNGTDTGSAPTSGRFYKLQVSLVP